MILLTPDLFSLMQKRDELDKQIDALIANQGESIILKNFKEFFDTNPYVVEVTWSQYTPFFNDGEPCYFQVYWEGHFRTNFQDDWENTELWHDLPAWDNWLSIWEIEYFKKQNPDHLSIPNVDFWTPEVIKSFQESVAPVNKLMAMPDLLLKIFGDHTQIFVDRYGTITVNDYSSHD